MSRRLVGIAMEEHRDVLHPGTLLDGKYRIERVLGSGGFGITYEATDLGLDTRVAVKEYYPASFATRDSTRTVRPISGREQGMFQRLLASFLREARTLARFDSPAIVRVNNVFELHGTAYMIMRYEPGPSLKAWRVQLDRAPTQEEMDRITAPLLDALEMLHSNDFLHRDVAPDNIIIRPDGTPVLLDFGASRRVMGELTSNLTAIVKPGFSPPEQYTADASLQGPWTDIYALGATIYQIVTDSKPTEASQRMGDRIDAASELLDAGMRPGFADAVDAALEFRPENRPQSIAEWREMLFEGAPRTRSGRLANVPRPDSGRNRDDGAQPSRPRSRPGERSGRSRVGGRSHVESEDRGVEERRRPSALVWLGGGVGALVLALGTWVAVDQVTRQSRVAAPLETPADIARRKAEEEARARALVAAADEARRRAEEEARAQAAAAAEEARRRTEEARLRAEEETRTRAAEEARRRAEEEARAKAAAEETRRRAEEARRRAEEEARARAVAAEEARRRAEEEARSRAAAAAEEARRKTEEEARARAAAAAAEEARRRAEEEARRQAELQPRELAFASPVQDDRPTAVAAGSGFVAAGGHSGHLRFWNLAENRVITVAEPHRDQVTSVAISIDGQRVAAGSWNGELRIFDAQTGRLDRVEPADTPDTIRALRFVARDQLIVVHSSGRVRNINPEAAPSASAQRSQSTFAVPGGSAPTAAISNDGTRIAAATTDGAIAYWNPVNGQAVGQPLRGHKDWPLAITFSRDGRRLASGAADGAIRVWDLSSRQAQELKADRSVRALAFSPDGRLLASAGDDNQVTLWVLSTQAGVQPRVLSRLSGHRDTIRAVAFDGDGKRVVSAGEDGVVRSWPVPAP